MVSLIKLYILLLIFACQKNRSLDNVLKKLDINIELVDDFTVIESSNSIFNKRKVEKIIADSENERIELRIIQNYNREDAESYIKNQELLVLSNFDIYMAPYPGQISNLIKCEEKFLPIKEEMKTQKIMGVRFFLFSNDRYNIGECNEDLLIYKTAFSILYCIGKKTIYEFSYFTPKNKPNAKFHNIVKSFKCGKTK